MRSGADLTNSYVEIPTNGEWMDFSYDITPDNLHTSPSTLKQGDNARSLDEIIINTTGIRFIVYKDVDNREIVFKGKLGLDDITAVGASPVPLPAKAWLMISACSPNMSISIENLNPTSTEPISVAIHCLKNDFVPVSFRKITIY